MMRTIPDLCEYVEGLHYESGEGSGTHMVACSRKPSAAVRVLGLSPLYICGQHVVVLRTTLAFYSKDITVKILR